MLWCLFLFGILTLIHGSNAANVRVVKSVSTSLISDSQAYDKHETAHKRMKANEFQTAHKIDNARFAMKDVSNNIMQQQNPQILLSSKERPELNPALSVLINEDIMKSIESTRSEYNKLDKASYLTFNEAENETSTATPNGEENIYILTTSEKSIRDSDLDAPNGSLVDNDFNLDEAGSESNQKSRIQIKKGPNGVDYEYEYVYYYYDDDEKSDNRAINKQKEHTTAATIKEATARGKSRYTNVDRSGKPEPENEIQIRSRSNSGLPSSDIDDVRLPLNTRFPPRSRGGDVTPTPEATSEKNGRRTGVKRPSLDFIDSDTFNTDEKQVKSNRNIENELGRKTSETSTTGENLERQTLISDSEERDGTTNAELDVENTTPLMEKSAWDLYAIIANENFNIDATTVDSSDLTTTDSPTTNGEDMTTLTEEEIVTTTLATTTEPTTTTTTTTITPANAPSGRKGLGGRNKFKSKSGSTTTTTTEAPVETGKLGNKSKGRFGGRPSFGSGRVSRPSKNQKEGVNEEVVKQDVKPQSSSSSTLRGRTRNRFNLRGSTSTTEKSNEENTIETKFLSTTPKTSRNRPSLNLRGRARVTTAHPPSVSETENKLDEEKFSTPSVSLTRPSRFNLGRPAGANRLLPRGRVSPLKPTSGSHLPKENTADVELSADDSNNDTASNPAHEDTSPVNLTEEKPAQGSQPVGLNRLKSKTKVLPTQKSSKSPASAIVRKPNPLIGRKRIGASSTTTEAPNESESTKSEINENDNLAEENEDTHKEAASEHIIEISSEQPTKGLGLLANKRRLLLRKPGVAA